jgi:hypothetical protein
MKINDFETLSLVADLSGQKSFEHTVEALLEDFPKNLSAAKEYFTYLIDYKKLTDDYFKTKDESARKVMKKELLNLEKNIKHVLNSALSPLKEYLQLHYLLTGQFNNKGELGFKEEREKEELNNDNMKAIKLYRFLEKNNFSSVHFIGSRIFRDWDEVIASLKKGMDEGDPSAAITLANHYLNAVLVNDTNRMELLKQNFKDVNAALKVIETGIKRNNPTAISYANSFIDRFLSAAPHLYMTEESPQSKEILKNIGKNAMELCEALKLDKIKADIKKVIEFDPSKEDAKQLAKQITKEAQSALKKDFTQNAKVLESKSLEKLPKFIKYKQSIPEVISVFNEYIKNAEKRSSMAWKYSLYQKGRRKNIEFAKELRNELYSAMFQGSSEKLTETMNKIRNKFEKHTTSKELNTALSKGLENLYPQIRKAKPE